MQDHEVNLGLLSSGYRNSSDKHDQKTADELDAAAEYIAKLEARIESAKLILVDGLCDDPDCEICPAHKDVLKALEGE